jgi:hypothetical protein
MGAAHLLLLHPHHRRDVATNHHRGIVHPWAAEGRRGRRRQDRLGISQHLRDSYFRRNFV